MSTKLTRERIKEILLSVTPLLSRDEPEGWQALDELLAHTEATIQDPVHPLARISEDFGVDIRGMSDANLVKMVTSIDAYIASKTK